MPSAKKLAFLGTIWVIIGYGGGQALRLVNSLILTRLLVPDLFGLMSTVYVFIVAVSLLSDIGTGPCIIRSPRGSDPDFFNTAWTMEVIRGFVLWFGCLGLAGIGAKFYNEPQLLIVLPVVSLNLITDGFSSTSVDELNRRVEFGRVTILSFITELVSVIVTVIWALISPTIWALVAGTLISAVFEMVASYYLVPNYSNRFQWDKEAAKEIFSFGKWIFLSTAITLIATQSDRFILPKLLSFAALGVYILAFNFASIPENLLGTLSNKIIFPLFSKYADIPRRELRGKILRERWRILLGMALLVAILTCFGDWVIEILYSTKTEGMKNYADAAWMLPILAVGIWPNVLFETISPSLMAVGKANYQAYAQFFKALYLCIGLPIGFHFMGLLGFVIAVTLKDIPMYIAFGYGLSCEKLSSFKQDFLATLLFIAMVVVLLAGRYFIGLGFPIDELLSGAA